MKAAPAKHFFECFPPLLNKDEEEVWFRHPILPLQCNQLGVIEYDEEVYTCTNQSKIKMVWNGKADWIGTREKIVMDCYEGFSHKHYIFFHRDGNLCDFRYENLVGFRSRTEEFKQHFQARKQFWKATLDYMDSRLPFIVARGIDPKDYWKIMDLPYELYVKWEKHYQGEYVPPKTRGAYKTQSHKRMQEIRKLMDTGMGSRAIAVELDLKRTTVQYWLKKIRDEKDI